MENSTEKKQNSNEKINTCKFCQIPESVTNLNHVVIFNHKYGVITSYYYCAACRINSIKFKYKTISEISQTFSLRSLRSLHGMAAHS